MSAQINLYHPRFLLRRDRLSLANVALAAGVVYAVLAAAGGLAWRAAEDRRQAASAVEEQLKAVKAQVEVASKSMSRKASPQLVAEAERAESLLRRRGDVARMLESGVIGSTGGFSDYLRGFARQTPEGLWLTGFSIGAGGVDMELRGSALDPGALPEFIRRMGAEKIFQGRSFAALTLNRAEPAPAPRAAGQVAAGQGAAVAPAPTLAQPPIDFVLLPKLVEARESKP